MYIMRMLDEIFCRHQLGPFYLWCDLVLGFFVWMTYLLMIGQVTIELTFCFSAIQILSCLVKIACKEENVGHNIYPVHHCKKQDCIITSKCLPKDSQREMLWRKIKPVHLYIRCTQND
jgi:hypothetical protein